ncbi:transmembrane protein 47 isoform X2 [Lingula anatina]|uniref:Transmembrane protein 47 isoform X1 n=1 Tax=Lingula anatina TaxID=7574 RepID=A0A1S3ISH1_LINAN|nr:transmembrane protein 47 isoform X1 [Lingula anatina]XP_013400886.1 transmembrane protein 47 isoform X2 [Lingula anatina]|eukprot:XP_013400885.1 transmembrane protein 47 isoform X1 [Lingula anatina]
MAPTAEIETVVIVRPLKVLALIFGCLASLLLLIAIIPTHWLQTSIYREGLFVACKMPPNHSLIHDDQVETCFALSGQVWTQAVAAMCIISLLITAASTVVTGLALCNKEPDRKYTFYMVAMVGFGLAAIFLVIGLIVYPIMFWQNMVFKLEDGGKEWEFAWAYGLAWASVLVILTAAILLFVERDADEIDYREKVHHDYSNDGKETEA